MDFSLPREEDERREGGGRFAPADLPALAVELEEKHAPVPPAMMKRYADIGFLGINLPEEYGGYGMSHLDAVLLLEELPQGSPAGAFPAFASFFLPLLSIAHFSPESLKQ